MSDHNDDDEKPYEVGYGKPPKNTRYKPGESGNPNGKPIGAKTIASHLREQLDGKVSYTDKHGRKCQTTRRKAIIMGAVNDALKSSLPDKLKFLNFVNENAPDLFLDKRELSLEVHYVYSDDPRALKPPPAGTKMIDGHIMGEPKKRRPK